MSVCLHGPNALELASPEVGLRDALQAAEAGPEGPETDGRAPGLYLLWDRAGAEPTLRGLWLTLGPEWVTDGAIEGEDAPPLVRVVLDQLTEAVWWSRLPVGAGRRWSPVVVLEWPPALADRSAAAPPATRPARVEESRRRPDEDGEGWLDAPRDRSEVTDERRPGAAGEGPGRSLLCVVACTLELEGGRHRGRYAVVQPLPAETCEAWLASVGRGEVAAARGGADLGCDLPLPGGRLGRPLAGWLGSELQPLPRHGLADEALVGALPPREVGSRLLVQLRSAGALTGAVLAAVLLVGVAVQLASTPEVRAALRVPEPEAQPAMSLCSVEHQPFVDALRCELAAASGQTLPGCDERGDSVARVDLQASWCGLRDRPDDALGRFDHAHLAASQACYGVLGAPWSYRLDAEGSGRGTADPQRFLEDPQLAIAGLQEAVTALDRACDRQRTRLEAQVEGAVLVGLVGGPDDEAAALRDAVLDQAGRGRSAEERRCLAAGAAGGVTGIESYAQLCDGETAEAEPAWAALAGSNATGPGLAARYLSARFGPQPPRRGEAPELWACHVDLVEAPRSVSVATRWDQRLPLPGGYGAGLVRRQLQLEAGLQAMAEDGVDAGACWAVAGRALQAWPMAHPLLAPASEGWPAPEQQLCGQICAAAVGLREPSAGPWLTPGADLGACVDSGPVVGGAGGADFDPLRLPWNGEPRTPPSAQEICAFHLVAQGWLGAAAGPVLVDALPPPLWAGEATVGSRIAGGREGAAVQSVENLGSYGRARSRASCGHVAAQCFAGGAVAITSDPRLEPYQWAERWRSWVAELPTRRPDELAAAAPWCARIQPYLVAEGGLPEGELDFPCTKGVDEVRQAFLAELGALARAGGGR